MSRMAGYSQTALARKLGLKEDSVVGLVNAPKGFEQQLDPLPERCDIKRKLGRGQFDIIVFFSDSQKRLQEFFAKLAPRVYPKGMLWIAWPKKSSGRATDLSFDVVQKLGLASGLVDVKICAVDEIWSGLKFVYRLKDR